MKRLLIFTLLGPLLGFVTGFYIMPPLMNVAIGGQSEFSSYQLVLLPLAYFMGLVPAFITGVFDHRMSHRRLRILWTTLFAFGASFIPLLGAILSGFFSPWFLPFGLVGAVPGAICSWLSGPGPLFPAQPETLSPR